MNNDQNKAHPHPYGSTVIPTRNGFSSAGPTKVPSVAGLRAMEVEVAKHPCTLPEPTQQPSNVATALDVLIDAIADRVADRVLARLVAVPPTISVRDQVMADPAPVPDPESNLVALANQMHVDLEQALRERNHVKVLRFAPEPIVCLVRVIDSPQAAHCKFHEVTAYAQPYGQGYTDGARPNEYIVLCNGKRLWWTINLPHARRGKSNESGVGFTLDQLLQIVDGNLRAETLNEHGVIELTAGGYAKSSTVI